MIDLAPQTSSPTASVRTHPRLGFSGAGWIGRHRMAALARSGLVDLAVVHEPDADAAHQASEVAHAARFVESYDDLLASDIDAVVIATPNHLHAVQAIAALRSGRAVFCQKPLGRNAAETRAVIAAARTADRRLQVDLSYRGARGMRRIRDLVRGGALGRVYAIEAAFHNAYGPAKPWFYDAARAGGGCLLDLGVHLVDLALWTLDFPPVLAATGCLSHRDRASTVEDYAAGRLELAGETTFQFACSWHAPAGCDAEIRLTFFGTEAGATFRNVNGSFYDFSAELLRADRTRETLSAPPDEWGGRAIVAWAERLAVDSGFDPEVEKLEAVATTLDAIYGRTA